MTPDDKIEVWLGLVMYPGYDVSSFGRVRSYPKRLGQIEPESEPYLLNGCVRKTGYPEYTLTVNGKAVLRKSHRLVLEAFVGLCPPGYVGRHLDGNPGNNHLSNLCWGTCQENADDTVRHGRLHPAKGSANSRSKISEADVREMFRLRQLGYTLVEIGLRFSIHYSLVCRIMKRERWTHVAV